MEIKIFNYLLVKGIITLLLCATLVSAQEYDCKRYCNADCSEYFPGSGSGPSGDFSDCVSANVHCSCGLPWFATLIIVISGLIFGAVCCCGFFRACQHSNGGSFGTYRGVQSSPVRPTNMFNYAPNSATNSMPTRIHATTTYPPQISNNFDTGGFVRQDLNTNFGQAQPVQPSFNPAFLENASAPGFHEVNNGPDRGQFDAPPTYEEVVRPETHKTN